MRKKLIKLTIGDFKSRLVAQLTTKKCSNWTFFHKRANNGGKITAARAQIAFLQSRLARKLIDSGRLSFNNKKKIDFLNRFLLKNLLFSSLQIGHPISASVPQGAEDLATSRCPTKLWLQSFRVTPERKRKSKRRPPLRKKLTFFRQRSKLDVKKKFSN